MKAAGRGGAIVQTGSMWGLQAIGATPSSAYSAANGGVHALVKNLAIELAPDKIRVNAIAPGVIETPVYSTFLTPEQVKAVLPTFNAMHPLGRNGQPADAAEALLFLASDQASGLIQSGDSQIVRSSSSSHDESGNYGQGHAGRSPSA
jgi:NAD(P)-dependent dehydrogenase (short-subunit alcohol dehydrogenase family)